MFKLDNKVKTTYTKFFFLIFCIAISILTLNFNNNQFQLLFLLPLMYGLVCIFVPNFLNGFSLKTPGFFILNIVMMLRYLALPLALKFSGYYRDVSTPFAHSYNYAILLMAVELLTIGVSVLFFNRIYKLNTKDVPVLELEKANKKPKNFIVSLVLIGFIFIILSDTSILKSFSFINIQDGFSKQDVNEQITAGTISSLALAWFRLLFPIFWIKICKSMYTKTKVRYWAYAACIIPILSLLFFSGMSRSSILIPALALAIILSRTFPTLRKKMYIIILSAAVFSVTILTIYKTFSTTSVSQGFNKMDINWISNTLEAYFGGVYNVAISINAGEFFKDSINFETLLADLFRSWMGIGAFFRDSYSTSEFFNIAFYGKIVTYDQVVPTIGSSYMIFGTFGSMIFTVLFVWIICLFEKLFRQETTIELAYLYGFTAIQSAFNLPGNFLIVSSYLLNTFLPLFIIFKINQIIILKRSSGLRRTW